MPSKQIGSNKMIEVGQILSTNEVFCLDIPNIITGRTFIASITRWGKSWTARKLTEECFGHAGIIIIDPEGEYASLREKYPFLIIGKDIPIQLETAEFMAEKILETKTSVIIDLSTTEVELGKEYVDVFLKRFFFLETTVRSPYLVVVEEAEDFGPEKGIATATCLDILRNIAKKGGKRGIGLLMIAHRPAWVSKGILSQCLPVGEKVITSEGLKPIETLCVGDYVLTHTGCFQNVTKLFSRMYDGELVEFRTRGWNGFTRVTPDHPVLVRRLSKPSTRWVGGKDVAIPILDRLQSRQWISASDLTRNDYVVFPRMSEVEDLPSVCINHTYKSNNGKSMGRTVELQIPVNFDLMRVIGYYLSEGSVRKHVPPTALSVRWSFGKALKEKGYADELSHCLQRLGFKNNIHKMQGCWEVTCSNTPLANWLIKSFGKGALNKHVPLWVKKLPSNKLSEMLVALINGDGWRDKKRLGQLNLTTVSEQLANDTRCIALKIGRRAFIYKHDGSNIIQGRKVNAHPHYLINISPPKSLKGFGATPIDNEAIYLKVQEVRKVIYSGKLHNLEVKNGNSYCSTSHTLHNCANKAIGRIDWPGDLAVIEEYLRIPKTMINKVPTLEKGEFLFIGDWVEKTAFVKVGPVKTTHLGYTPEVIPPSPKELESVIASLQKALPQILEKIKPTVLPIAEMKAEVKKELEQKYQDRIQGIIKTADEKSERKYKARIDELQDHIEKLSRSQALQPVAPISDVLEHPIVKSRMLELPDKGRDLLVKVEREPGLTREQLAAFLTTSTNSVANLVDRINHIFHATTIIGEGKPLRYKSVLKRLFITDVGKREIEELGRLQRTITEQQSTIASLEPQIEELRRRRVEVNELGRTLRSLESQKEAHERQISTLQGNIDVLEREKQEMTASNKAASALKTAIDMIVGERTPNIKGDPQQSQGISEEAVNTIVDKKLNEKLAKMPTPTGNISTTVSLEHKVAHFDYQAQEEHFKADTTSLQGRIVFLITKGFFDQRHNRKEVVTELSNKGWSHDDKEVDAVLLELCQKGIFYRKISTGNVFWYTLEPEAKEHIHQ